ncbi:hypothetical protein AMJ86_10280 [bacterium SM23_57]|nr:MAG: hypothetical protein AMJ86_10280 [bacterium SM23_57]
MKLAHPAKRFLLWFAAILWTAVIFLTLPYAPVWRDWIAEHLHEVVILIAVIAILLLVFIATMVRMIRRKASFPDYVFYVLIVIGYIYSLSRIDIVVEQVHFVEYGLLAWFIISALRTDWKDSGQYLTTLLLISLVGIVDEYIQGVLVNRVGELHDVYLNILSGALALAWLRFCVKIDETPSNWRTVFAMALPVAGLIILGIGIFNSRISQFGYYIKNPEIGEFYSRIPVDRLKDKLPGSEYFKTEILPKLSDGSYSELLSTLKGSIYSEVLVHIFCRDKRLERGDMYTAFRENQILEKYFSNFIIGTEYQWTDRKTTEVEQVCIDNFDDLYKSPVSAHIITSFSETAQWIIICILEGGIILIWLAVLLRRGRIGH